MCVVGLHYCQMPSVMARSFFFSVCFFFFTDPHNVCTQLAFIGSVPALKDVALLPLCPLIMDRAERE